MKPIKCTCRHVQISNRHRLVAYTRIGGGPWILPRKTRVFLVHVDDGIDPKAEAEGCWKTRLLVHDFGA